MYLIMSDHVSDHVWSCIWSCRLIMCMTVHDRAWPCMTMHDRVWPFLESDGSCSVFPSILNTTYMTPDDDFGTLMSVCAARSGSYAVHHNSCDLSVCHARQFCGVSDLLIDILGAEPAYLSWPCVGKGCDIVSERSLGKQKLGKKFLSNNYSYFTAYFSYFAHIFHCGPQNVCMSLEEGVGVHRDYRWLLIIYCRNTVQ